MVCKYRSTCFDSDSGSGARQTAELAAQMNAQMTAMDERLKGMDLHYINMVCKCRSTC